ncbi:MULTISPECIES: hypothetical protein [Bacillus]|uniref:Uncharacterized protein n=1 Tax=Bacillus pseudomycoides TaxID=64104 RepID=A0A1Y3MEE1_9BACI|nr:hypothetical protein [Bacillus pseudomycoides]OUM46800.1 hypothetical protein BW425_21565 [Bacillus pseudomycoides]
MSEWKWREKEFAVEMNIRVYALTIASFVAGLAELIIGGVSYLVNNRLSEEMYSNWKAQLK